MKKKIVIERLKKLRGKFLGFDVYETVETGIIKRNKKC